MKDIIKSNAFRILFFLPHVSKSMYPLEGSLNNTFADKLTNIIFFITIFKDLKYDFLAGGYISSAIETNNFRISREAQAITDSLENLIFEIAV